MFSSKSSGLYQSSPYLRLISKYPVKHQVKRARYASTAKPNLSRTRVMPGEIRRKQRVIKRGRYKRKVNDRNKGGELRPDSQKRQGSFFGHRNQSSWRQLLRQR